MVSRGVWCFYDGVFNGLSGIGVLMQTPQSGIGVIC